MLKLNALYAMAYEMATNAGNTHKQAVAYAEWRLFSELANHAPEGSYAAGRRAAEWLAIVADLRVIQPEGARV